MPAFELVDMDEYATFFLTYSDFDSIVTPDFTGQQVRGYIELSKVATRLTHLSHAFPSLDEDDDYFNQCLSSFSHSKLYSFLRRSNSSEARILFNAARTFQSTTVRKWKRSADECSLSIYLGLICIDEAASKECGAITLDLLLRAGVLVASEDGSWILSDDWNLRQI